ncbi:BRCT domain-containing protein [Arthroderma uncinatum]|uniref:BRCT domain-containing protein n=1 Tax=Arthroderma uncinatum TaxID=74035 RepID=UPI00144AA582|nr:BRCT domain-containing protein [Arthroderma uncinatum]KAF3479772.1 BRCT domain-containing protein [Arthroderma uncinatum]
METQEDSLDLTYIKNAALGLNESQTSLNRHTAFAITRRLTSKAADYGPIFEYGKLSKQSLAAAEKPTCSPTSSVKHDLSDEHDKQPTHNAAMSSIKSSRLSRSNTTPEPQDGERSPSGSFLGDTQPVSQSVYEGLLNSRTMEDNSTEGPFIHIIEGTDGGTTQMTLNEGDTGHVDLFSEFDNAAGPDNPHEDRGSQASDIGNSSPTQYEPFPESQRFNTSTPAVQAGRSFSNLANTVTPSTVRNPFKPENKTPGSVMALSQLFNATQAASSPSARMPRLELPSDMPSPNIPIQRPMRTPFSSIALTSSISRPDPIEPEANYISMMESQTEREKRSLRQQSEPGLIDRDDDIFQDGESAIERRIRQMQSKNEARKEFENIKAPARAVSRRNSKRSVSSSPPLAALHTVHREKALRPVLESNDEEQAINTDRGEDSEVETEQEEICMIPQPRSSQRTQSFGEEDKENVDSGPVQTSNIAVSTHSALSTVLDLDQSPSANRQRAAGLLCSPTERLSVGHAPNSGQGIRPPWASQPETSGNSWDFVLQYGTQGKELARDTTFLGHRITSNDHERRRRGLLKRIPSSPPIQDIDRIIQSQPDDDDELSVPQIQPSPSPLPKAVNQSLLSSHHPTHDKDDSELQKPGKESSITSRVFETPSQPILDTRDLLRTIPETSPAGQRRSLSRPITVAGHLARVDETVDGTDEDDNLPDPPRFRGSGILQSLGSQELAASRTSRRVQAILSSPSGRQRRSMTAIASDESPRPAVSDIPINEIRLINAEDRMFQSMIASGGSPFKRRRGNDGRRIESLVQTHQRSLANELDNTSTQIHMSPVDHGADEPLKSPQTTPRPPPQTLESPSDEDATDIWDVVVSPQKETQKPEPPRTVNNTQKKVQKDGLTHSRKKYKVLEAVVIQHPSSSSLTPLEALSRTPSSPSLQTRTEPSSSIHELDQNLEEANKEVIAANHIFAFFNGRPTGYYPAVCVATSDGVTSQRILVRFEDSDKPEKIDIRGAKTLELKIGDIVKVNLPDVPKVPHYVTGFGTKIQSPIDPDENMSDWDKQMSDIYGHTTVRLKRKLTKIVPKVKIPRSISVPISKIYMDQNLWSRFGERPYSPRSSLLRDSRSAVHQTMEQSMQSRITQASQTPNLEPERTGIFSGMAFALSYSGNEKRGKDVESMLSDNGGVILKDGFDQLFEHSSWALALPTSTAEQVKTEGPLTLTPRAKEMGFTCLITDQYSRRAKYMQALALNLPCLAGQWVYECIEKQKVVEWEPYLLAAGSSIFLDNAVKSRILTSYPPSAAKLFDTISVRPRVFANQFMLFVMGRKQAAQQRKAYAFLTCALGAERVYPVQTLQAALDIISQATDLDPKPKGWENGSSSWDWIYVGDESAAATARGALSKLQSASAVAHEEEG